MSKLTALDTIKHIVGERVIFCSTASDGHYAICTPLLAAFKNGMFAPCDPKFGAVVGIIGIPHPTSSHGKDIASAAHESFHAWLHLNGGDWTDEQIVNDHSETWLKKNMTGFALFSALEHILESRISYNNA